MCSLPSLNRWALGTTFASSRTVGAPHCLRRAKPAVLRPCRLLIGCARWARQTTCESATQTAARPCTLPAARSATSEGKIVSVLRLAQGPTRACVLGDACIVSLVHSFTSLYAFSPHFLFYVIRSGQARSCEMAVCARSRGRRASVEPRRLHADAQSLPRRPH